MSKTWSHPTWLFYHSFAENMDETFYTTNKEACLEILRTISSRLPCSYCRQHAQRYLAAVSIRRLPTKDSFKEMVWAFHNNVNSRLHKPMYPYENLSEYKNRDIIKDYDNMHSAIITIKKLPFSLSVSKNDDIILYKIRFSLLKYKKYFL